MSLNEPSPNQVVQRGTNGNGDIVIAGIIRGTHGLEARFNGGSWQAVSAPVSGDFTVTLTNQAAGQGTLEVRLTDQPTVSATVTNVGIGDVFVVAGQSNASGQGSNNQSYAHATLRAGAFANDYTWKNLTDPSDSASGQIDSVSSDPAAAGSVWPLVASWFMTNQAVPVAFVPCAKGATIITSWQAGADHTNRSTLYGSMTHRAKHAIRGGVKAVLWWQGESDIGVSTTAQYQSNLTQFATNVLTDLGVKVMPCKFQHCVGSSESSQSNLWQAVSNAWVNNTTVIAVGPDLSDIDSDDTAHLKSNAKLATAAERWWLSLKAAFYP